MNKVSELKFRGQCRKFLGATHPAFYGKHNVVGIYEKGVPVGKRCASCGEVAK